MKELVEKVAELYAAFEKDAKAQIENGNKAAGTRVLTNKPPLLKFTQTP